MAQLPESDPDWINGVSNIFSPYYGGKVESIVLLLHNAWQLLLTAPRQPSTNWRRHIYREFNGAADELAKRAVEHQKSECWSRQLIPRPRRLRGHCDGSRCPPHAGAGWLVEASWFDDNQGEPLWERVATGSLYLGDSTIVNAELTGTTEVVRAIM